MVVNFFNGKLQLVATGKFLCKLFHHEKDCGSRKMVASLKKSAGLYQKAFRVV